MVRQLEPVAGGLSHSHIGQSLPNLRQTEIEKCERCVCKASANY